MNNLLLALQEFKDLCPLQEINMTVEKSDRIEAWLKDSVCPAIEELVDVRTFQSNTLWSVSHLSKGVDTRERKLLEYVDDCLVKLTVQIKTCLPYLDRPILTEFQINGIKLIAERPWFDLVDSDDFALPAQRLMLDKSNNQHTLNFRKVKQITTPGDHVCDSMFARIEYWKGILDQICGVCFRTKQIVDEQSNREFSSLMGCVAQLETSIKNLKNACLKPKVKTLRDACVTLSLVYLSYADHPEVSWLVRDSSEAEVISNMFRRNIVRRPGETLHYEKQPNDTLKMIKKESALLCDPAVIRKVVKALGDIKSIYEVPDNPEDLIDWACSHVRLVLVDHSPRQVFWDGEPVESDWDTHLATWNLIWMLANNPKRVVDQQMLSNPLSQSIRSRRSRLKKSLSGCEALNQLIKTVHAQGYCLELDSDNIILLESDGLGGLNRVPTRKSSRINS